MVRPRAPLRGWERAPIPILVVEVLSQSTKRRDLNEKRSFYMEIGVAEYWAVDRESRTVLRVAPDGKERVATVLTWSPKSTAASLDVDVAAMFERVLAP